MIVSVGTTTSARGQCIFNIKKGHQTFLFFGAMHSRNPGDAQWAILKENWNIFVNSAKTKKVIFTEGPDFKIDTTLSLDETVRKYGEAGFLSTCVNSEDVELHSPEFPLREEMEKLSEYFDGDLVEYFIFARTAGAWLGNGAQGTYEEIIKRAAASNPRITSSANEVSYFSNIHNKIFGRSMNEAEKKVIMRAAAPVFYDSVINDIARASNKIRDDRLVSEVLRYWERGYSIFVVFGSHHAITLEDRFGAVL